MITDKLQKKQYRKVDKSKALKMRLENGNTYQEIADCMGTSKQAIQSAIHKLMPVKQEVETFKNHRADILANVQLKMLESYNALSDSDKSEMVRKRGLVDMGIAFDKERLTRGLSSDNIAVTVQAIQQLQELTG